MHYCVSRRYCNLLLSLFTAHDPIFIHFALIFMNKIILLICNKLEAGSGCVRARVEGARAYHKTMSSSPSSSPSPLATIRKHWFIIGVILVISCARLAPWVGAKQG